MTARALAVVVVGEVIRRAWRAYSDMCRDIANLDNRVRRLEAPHDVMAHEIDLPKRWRR